MNFPIIEDIARYEDKTAQFGGYNHVTACDDGQFYDMYNMTNQKFPVLAPRQKRAFLKQMENPQGVLDKESLIWVDDGKLYIDGEEVEGISLNGEKKSMAKMGAFVVIFPDKVWYNTKTKEHGSMESSYSYTGTVKMELCSASGAIITWHDPAYYEENAPQDGDYMLSTVNGKASLKIYSSIMSSWQGVASTYFKINAAGIGAGFDKDDGVKITVDTTGNEWDYVDKVFPNDEGNGKYSNNMAVIDKDDDNITVVGLLDDNHTFENMTITVGREVPDMEFVTECQNRLWGCSKDGHEIYACKLGDVKNWNLFLGISTDSYAVTIGSDGVFTGAITFLGYPMFFKEDSIIKIAVSGTGAHQVKETVARGVQRGSHDSLTIVNELLMYKSATDVCIYTGSVPAGVSDPLGEVRYYDAVGGSIDNRYYISMHDDKGKYHLFVYDRKTGTWVKEDNTEVFAFCKHGDDLLFIDSGDKKLKSVRGTITDPATEKMEANFKWMFESGILAYGMDETKYIGKISIRLSMEKGTSVECFLQYDDGEWERKFNIFGNNTRSVTIPVIPKRCDHFKFKLVGNGGCNIYSITKRYERGSDSIGSGNFTVS